MQSPAAQLRTLDAAADVASAIASRARAASASSIPALVVDHRFVGVVAVTMRRGAPGERAAVALMVFTWFSAGGECDPHATSTERIASRR